MNPQLVKGLKSLAIGAAGVAATYLLQGVSGMDFGAYTPLVVAGASWLTAVVKNFVEAQAGK